MAYQIWSRGVGEGGLEEGGLGGEKGWGEGVDIHKSCIGGCRGDKGRKGGGGVRYIAGTFTY